MCELESLPATKNHQGLGDSEDETDAKIFSVPDSETGQQLSPHIQLELMRGQSQQAKGTLIEFLMRIILTQRLSHGDQSVPPIVYNCYVPVHN